MRDRALREFARASVDALAARGIIQPALSRTLFDERIGEHAGYYGEMVWILMMLEQWLARPPRADRTSGCRCLSPERTSRR